jgi:hypothetical protein
MRQCGHKIFMLNPQLFRAVAMPRTAVNSRLMPDSAVNATSESLPSASGNEGLFGAGGATTLERAARSAQRVEHMSQLPRGVTPDLFAEDIERLTVQAMNTDVRQGTLAGFELPDAFLATVCATAGVGDAPSDKRPAREAAAQAQIDLLANEEQGLGCASQIMQLNGDL